MRCGVRGGNLGAVILPRKSRNLSPSCGLQSAFCMIFNHYAANEIVREAVCRSNVCETWNTEASTPYTDNMNITGCSKQVLK